RKATEAAGRERDKAAAELKQAQEAARGAAAAGYVALVRRAAQLVEARSFVEARRVLDRCDAARRGWEWHLLARQCDLGRGNPKARVDRPQTVALVARDTNQEGDPVNRPFAPTAAVITRWEA